MKAFSKSFLMLATWVAMTLTSCSKVDNSAVGPQPTEPEKARYSVIVYGNAGGRMDHIIESVWERCKPLMKDGTVRVAFFYKYGKDSKDEPFRGKYAKPGDVVFFELTKDTKLEDISKDAFNSSEWPLYNPASLTYAINTVKENMPAEEYIFVLYGHGGGFDVNIDYPKDWRKDDVPANRRGVLYDEWIPTIAGAEAMDMYEFRDGIMDSEVSHFKGIFFHNCLMGNMEILDDIYDVSDYLITSMHVLSSDGTSIVELIKGLYDTSDFEAAAKQMFGRIKPGMPEDYFYDGVKINGDMNLIKTSEFNKLNPIFTKLAKRLVELYPTQKEAIDRAGDKTYKVDRSNPFFDALDYANKLAAETNDEQLKAIAAELKAAFDATFADRIGAYQKEDAPMKEFTLSLVLTDKEGYNKKTAWDYLFSKAYDFTDFSIITEWNKWLQTNTHVPTDNPTGQIF